MRRLSLSATGHTLVRHCIDPALVERGRQEGVLWGMIPPRNSGIMLFEETVNGVRVPARIEGVAGTRGALAELTRLAQIQTEAACGRKLALFKDKINFKHPGGGQFVAHQDSPAYYPHGSWHISALVPLMPFTEANGALEIAARVPLMPMEQLLDLEYSLVPVYPGDCLVFDGLTPHRSGPNTTTTPRLGLYLTFVEEHEAGTRDSYRKARIAGTDGLSLGQVDFTGSLVPSELLVSTARAGE